MKLQKMEIWMIRITEHFGPKIDYSLEETAALVCWAFSFVHILLMVEF